MTEASGTCIVDTQNFRQVIAFIQTTVTNQHLANIFGKNARLSCAVYQFTSGIEALLVTEKAFASEFVDINLEKLPDTMTDFFLWFVLVYL